MIDKTVRLPHAIQLHVREFPRIAGETVKDFIESLGGEERLPANSMNLSK